MQWSGAPDPAAALTAWGGGGRILRPLVGGHRNRVFLVELNGQPLVLKSTRHGEASLNWVRGLAGPAAQAGVSLPEIVPTWSGRLKAEGWMLERFAAGLPPNPIGMAAVRRRVGHLHQMTRRLPQRPGAVASTDLAYGARGFDADLSVLPDRLAARLGGLLRAGDSGPVGVVHGDLVSANVIWHQDGPPVVIDWDEARIDAGLFDQTGPVGRKARLAREIVACWRVEPARARRLVLKL